ncbi:MAG: hypothetical protein VYD85_16875, partial [Pseudomonadota bacterium]|nr:hypothetical protein [Pseudomonadota bacterium]
IEKFGLVILGVWGAHHMHMRDMRLEMQTQPGGVLICAGHDDDQIDFEEALNPLSGVQPVLLRFLEAIRKNGGAYCR